MEREALPARSMHRFAWLVSLAAAFGSNAAMAAHLELQIDGVEGPLRDAAVAAAGLQEYASRDVTAAQAHRLYDRAPKQIAAALEPYGYYNATADGELKETPTGYVAVVHVHLGEPTVVTDYAVVVPDVARDEKVVRKALAAFYPKKGDRIDHAAYEKSKAAVQAALLSTGYLDARLTTKSVEVSRGDNSASLHLTWDVGTRYRYGETTFEGSQFYDGFLDRYVPWHEGDFYSQDDLLRLQQQLIDADYFAVVEVQPEADKAHDGIVPIHVTLGPAKRNVYTAGVFLDTDIGFGVRGGLQRRWLNANGHKLKVEVQVAQKLKTASRRLFDSAAGSEQSQLQHRRRVSQRKHGYHRFAHAVAGRQRNAAMDGFYARARTAPAHRHVRHPRSARQQGPRGTRQHDAAVSGTRAGTQTRR